MSRYFHCKISIRHNPDGIVVFHYYNCPNFGILCQFMAAIVTVPHSCAWANPGIANTATAASVVFM